MRNLMIPLLLLSAAIPAMASADPGDRDERRAERQEQRGDRADRGGGGGQRQAQERAPQQQQQQQEAPRQMRMERTERAPDRVQAPQQQQQYVNRQSRQIERQADRQVERRQRMEQQQDGYARPDRARPDVAQRDWGNPNAGQPEVVREQRNRGPRVITTDGLPQDNRDFGQRSVARQDRGDVMRQDRPARGSFADRLDHNQERDLARRVRGPGLPPGSVTGIDPRVGGNTRGGELVATPLPGGGELRHSGSGSQWGTQWRGDRRYDWQDWRRHHHSSFHIGFYSDPFGYGYQRLGYGWQLFPSYYQSNYWLRDPWQYRLPPVYGPYRWVRYYDDALLVDTWSGEVVDVIYDFFW